MADHLTPEDARATETLTAEDAKRVREALREIDGAIASRHPTLLLGALFHARDVLRRLAGEGDT